MHFPPAARLQHERPGAICPLHRRAGHGRRRYRPPRQRTDRSPADRSASGAGEIARRRRFRYARRMLIERIWSANRYRNFHYLLACPETGEALAIDPLEWRLCLDAARQKGWTITQILNTHEHLDHTGGNAGLVGATQAKVLAHAD